MPTQNWDASTATPAGWSFDAGFGIVANATATSPPNVLSWAGTTSGTFAASYGTADDMAGQVVVSAKFRWTSFGTHHSEAGVLARATGCPVESQSALNFYTGWLDGPGAQCGISLWSGGNEFFVATTPLNAAAVALAVWYEIALTLDGAALSLAVTRLSDGATLDAASGGWSSTASVACEGTDSSVTGSGYAGLLAAVQQGGSGTFLSDDWSLSALAPAPAPAPPFAWRASPRATRRSPIVACPPPPPPVAPCPPPRIAPPAPRRRARPVSAPLVYAPPIAPAPPLPGLVAVPAVAGRRAVPPRPTRLAPPVTSFYPDTVHPSGAFSLGSFPTD